MEKGSRPKEKHTYYIIHCEQGNLSTHIKLEKRENSRNAARIEMI